MCWRFEGKGPAKVLTAFICSFAAAVCAAQVDYSPQIITLVERLCESGSDDEIMSLSEHFIALSHEKIDINRATAAQLEASLIFTPFMAASVLEYREEYGEIISLAELSLIDGFNAQYVELIAPFITLGGNLSVENHDKPACKNRLVVRSNYDREMSSVGLISKYDGSFSHWLQWGVTLENDAGERHWPDFYSASLSVSDISICDKIEIRRVVAGDYTVRLGQGLTIWNAATPSLLKRPSYTLVPYRSAVEHGYLHGAGVSIGLWDHLEMTLFYSNAGRDAKVDGESFFSLPKTGLHNSTSSLISRRSLREQSAGGSIAYEGQRWRCAVNFVTYFYNKTDGRAIKEWNKYLIFSPPGMNISADFIYSYQSLRLFAEVAVDKEWDPAFIAGVDYHFRNGIELTFATRYYDKRYFALHGGAIKRGSYCNNQYGSNITAKWMPLSYLNLDASFECTIFPGPRYRIPQQSYYLKGELSGLYSPRKALELSSRLSVKKTSEKENVTLKWKVKGCYKFPFGLQTVAELHLSYCGPFGAAMKIMAGYTNEDLHLNITADVILYNAKEWEGALYIYSREVPPSYSIHGYYGKGYSCHLSADWSPWRWLKGAVSWSYKGGVKASVTITF